MTSEEIIALAKAHTIFEWAVQGTGRLMRDLQKDLAARHPCVGDTRSIGLFGVIDLVRDGATREPLAPFGGTSKEMAALGAFFREHGLYTFVRWHYFFTNPPLSITEQELRDGFDIIDRGLSMVDGMLLQ